MSETQNVQQIKLILFHFFKMNPVNKVIDIYNFILSWEFHDR